MARAAEDRVPCSKATKESIRACKRAGETYDELFQKMLEQYDPESAYEWGAEG